MVFVNERTSSPSLKIIIPLNFLSTLKTALSMSFAVFTQHFCIHQIYETKQQKLLSTFFRLFSCVESLMLQI